MKKTMLCEEGKCVAVDVTYLNNDLEPRWTATFQTFKGNKVIVEGRGHIPQEYAPIKLYVELQND